MDFDFIDIHSQVRTFLKMFLLLVFPKSVVAVPCKIPCIMFQNDYESTSRNCFNPWLICLKVDVTTTLEFQEFQKVIFPLNDIMYYEISNEIYCIMS